MTENVIREKLFELRDDSYRDFTAKLIPTVEKKRIIGIRTPILRKFAKNVTRDGTFDFLAALPHYYYEENNLHAFIIEGIRDFDSCVFELQRFLPYVDNWATCDSMRPKALLKNTKKLSDVIDGWLSSGKTYTVRYGIGLYMSYFLDESFDSAVLDKVARLKSDEYYVKMMQSWFFATALAKQNNATRPYLEERKLDKWVHNKTICKAIESFRISDQEKDYLRTLRIK